MSISGFSKAPANLTIESVIPLSSAEKQQILTSLKIDPTRVELVNISNPALTAGLRISYQGKVLDLSLQNDLNQIKESIDE